MFSRKKRNQSDDSIVVTLRQLSQNRFHASDCRDFSFVLSPDTSVRISALAAEGGVSDVELGEYCFSLRLGNIFAIKDGRKSRRTARCRLKLPEDLVNEEASTPFLHGSYCVAGGVLARNTPTRKKGTIPGSGV